MFYVLEVHRAMLTWEVVCYEFECPQLVHTLPANDPPMCETCHAFGRDGNNRICPDCNGSGFS